MNNFNESTGEKDIKRVEDRVLRLYGLQRLSREQHDKALELIKQLRNVLTAPAEMNGHQKTAPEVGEKAVAVYN